MIQDIINESGVDIINYFLTQHLSLKTKAITLSAEKTIQQYEIKGKAVVNSIVGEDNKLPPSTKIQILGILIQIIGNDRIKQ